MKGGGNLIIGAAFYIDGGGGGGRPPPNAMVDPPLNSSGTECLQSTTFHDDSYDLNS